MEVSPQVGRAELVRERPEPRLAIKRSEYAGEKVGRKMIEKSSTIFAPIISFLVLASLAAGCGGTTGPTPTPAPEPTISSDFTTYTDEEQLFSISYPSDWELALSEFPRVEEDVRELLRLKESNSPLKDVVNIFAARVPGEASLIVGVEPVDVSTLDELAESRARDIEVLGLECTELAQVEALAGDRRVLIFDNECDMTDGGKYRGVQMYVLDGKMVWIVTCASSPEKFSSVKDTCNQAVRSLRILR